MPVLRKASAHGLGHLRAPYASDDPPEGVPEPVIPLAEIGVERWQHVAEITAAISGSQSHIGSWLSNTRNEINYQHKYSVWFPVKRNKNVNEILTRLKISSSNSIPLDLNTNKEPITSFIEICSYLALLSFEISEYVAARSRKGGAFGQKWRRLRATIV